MGFLGGVRGVLWGVSVGIWGSWGILGVIGGDPRGDLGVLAGGDGGPGGCSGGFWGVTGGLGCPAVRGAELQTAGEVLQVRCPQSR